MIFLRSFVFALMQIIITPVFSLVSILTFPFHPMTRYKVISQYARMMMFLVRVVCGINFRVEGKENMPDSPCVILSKHQSAWETFAFQVIFPPQVWVMKKELLWVPFFGWGLAMTSPIAINRGEGRAALKQLLDQGAERLKQGFWVVIFPEGTRIRPGENASFKIGGAWLATYAQVKALPVALNAGYLWGRKSFLRYPGIITVSIGKPIDPAGLKPGELNEVAEKWVHEETSRIGRPQ